MSFSLTPCALFATISAARGDKLLPADALYAALASAERKAHLTADHIFDRATGTARNATFAPA